MPERPSPCRDFVKGLCFRGKECRYFHPSSKEGQTSEICKDYINNVCKRPKCKYLHVDMQEEAKKDCRRKYSNKRRLSRESDSHDNNQKHDWESRSRDEVDLDYECENKSDRRKRSHDRTRSSKPDVDSERKEKKRSHYDEIFDFIDLTLIEQENEILKYEILDLEKEASALKEVNSGLCDENSRIQCQLDHQSYNSRGDADKENQY